jgi:hypothetical protein
MKSAIITEAKTHLTPGGEAEDGERLLRLVRDGLVRPRRAPPTLALFSQPPPRAKAGTSAVEGLIEERRLQRG